MKQVRKSSLKQLLLKGQKPPSKNLEIMKAVAGLEGWLLPPGCPTCPMTDRQTDRYQWNFSKTEPAKSDGV